MPRRLGLGQDAAEEIADGHSAVVFLAPHVLPQSLPFSRLLELPETQSHTALRGTDVDDLHVHFLARRQHIRGPLASFPGQLRIGYDALDSGLQADKRAERDHPGDRAVDDLADPVGLRDLLPGIGQDLLQPKRDAALLAVESQDHDVHLLAHLDGIARVIYASPRHLRDVEQAVHTAEVHESPVVGDSPHHAAVDLVLLQ